MPGKNNIIVQGLVHTQPFIGVDHVTVTLFINNH